MKNAIIGVMDTQTELHQPERKDWVPSWTLDELPAVLELITSPNANKEYPLFILKNLVESSAAKMWTTSNHVDSFTESSYEEIREAIKITYDWIASHLSYSVLNQVNYGQRGSLSQVYSDRIELVAQNPELFTADEQGQSIATYLVGDWYGMATDKYKVVKIFERYNRINADTVGFLWNALRRNKVGTASRAIKVLYKNIHKIMGLKEPMPYDWVDQLFA